MSLQLLTVVGARPQFIKAAAVSRAPTSTHGDELDTTMQPLQLSRAGLIRQAIEHCLDDIDHLQAGLAALKNHGDPVFGRSEV